MLLRTRTGFSILGVIATALFAITASFFVVLRFRHNDLPSDTRYGPFTVARTVETTPSLRFAALGDTGTGNNSQRSVANALINYSRRNPLDFILLLGDQFYPSGVSGIGDAQWDSKFEKVYRREALPGPFFPVLGNHEYDGDVEAFIAYSSRSSRWRAPGRYYTFISPVPGGSTVQFFALDSYSLGRWYRRLDGQLLWLEEQLKNSTAAWKIAFGHHPLVSAGKHANAKTTDELHRFLLPLFEKYGVQLYISGHDHNLQLLRVQPKLFQVISGGGGAPLHPVTARTDSLLAVSRLGFVAISLNSSTLSLTILSDREEVLFDAPVIISGAGVA